MGDRANVLVKGDGGAVYLYSHWEGHELPTTVQRALARQQRWNDAQYLARIIFSEMIRNSLLDETGFGISSIPGDGADKIIEVDVNAQTVKVGGTPPLSFEKFAKRKSAAW